MTQLVSFNWLLSCVGGGKERAPLDVRIATQIANRGIYLMAAAWFFAKMTRLKPGPKRAHWFRHTAWLVFVAALANTFIRGKLEAERRCAAFQQQVKTIRQTAAADIHDNDVPAVYQTVQQLLGGRLWQAMDSWCHETANTNPFPIPKDCADIANIKESIQLTKQREVITEGQEAMKAWTPEDLENQEPPTVESIWSSQVLQLAKTLASIGMANLIWR